MGKLEEMNKFLEYYNLLRKNHEEIENLNRLITIEIETVRKPKDPNKQNPRTEVFIDEFYQTFISVQFSSVAQSCPTLCNPMNHSMTGLPVHHQLPEFTQTHVH